MLDTLKSASLEHMVGIKRPCFKQDTSNDEKLHPRMLVISAQMDIITQKHAEKEREIRAGRRTGTETETGNISVLKQE